MSPVNPLFAVITLAVGLLTVVAMQKLTGYKPEGVKYLSIDGLRGFLAFFVFLTHASLYYYYARTGIWEVPPSNLFTHFGGTSVSLFFMITSFLFISKLIDSFHKPVNWLYLGVSRVTRLVPVYLFAVIVLALIVFIQSDFVFQDRISVFLKKMVLWGGFGIIDTPDLNAVPRTRYIMAGVTWSLVYEWIFYLSLPVIGFVFFRTRFSPVSIIVAVIGIGIILHYRHDLYYMSFLSFIGGIAAAFLIRWKAFCNFAISPLATAISVTCMVCCVAFFKVPASYGPIILSSVTFIIIACGNNWFGIFTNGVARMLGQLSYVIYLLHGMLLYLTFHFFVTKAGAELSVWQHWCIIYLLAVFLVIICFAVHVTIELPCMHTSRSITQKIERFFHYAAVKTEG